MKNRKNILFAVVILFVGLMLGWLIKPSDKTESNHQTIQSSDQQKIWTCSMHPQIRRNEAGSCPICGMDLIPMESQESSDHVNTYQMSENAMKLANIQTLIVGKGDASKEVRLNGKIQVDERHAYSQSTHIPGRIEQLFTNFTGEKVKKGQTLATIYSPELVAAQEELLQAASIKESQPELFEAAQEKLRNWKIGQGQIDRILTGGKALQRFTIQADVNGIVTNKMVDLGDYVERGMPIYEISDLSKVWALFDLYESELAWIKEGSQIEFTINSLPGETFKGKISFIDPLINSQTRVASARVEVDNKEGRLKPEMFVSGIVKNGTASVDSQEIVIPKSAVLWTGKRSVVYIKEGSGFLMREITLGPALGSAYMVTEGLKIGEEIVSNGAFTIDAAVQLSGRPSMMNPEGGGSMDHSHGETLSPKQMGESKEITVNEDGKKALAPLYTEYFLFQEYLAEDHFNKAKEAGIRMKKAIEKVDGIVFTGSALTVWAAFEKQIKIDLEHIEHQEEIESLRHVFRKISIEMIVLTKSFGALSEAVYLQHCPMADNDKGADWLSLSKEIKNPYFGNKMLHCGEITQVIE